MSLFSMLDALASSINTIIKLSQFRYDQVSKSGFNKKREADESE